MSDYKKVIKAIEKRFPGAMFCVSCFDTVDKIETKILTDADLILYSDTYYDRIIDVKTGTSKETEHYKDFFLIKKREGQSHIRYCDVIDAMIAVQFDRTCRHNFMEKISKLPNLSRNANSIPVYGSFWGS